MAKTRANAGPAVSVDTTFAFSITIRVPDASPRSVGALLFLYELAVLFWGRLAGVDPFGRPSVERIKVLTRASLTGSPADAVEALTKHGAAPRRVSR